MCFQETMRGLSLCVGETVTKLISLYQEHDVGCLMGKENYRSVDFETNMSIRWF